MMGNVIGLRLVSVREITLSSIADTPLVRPFLSLTASAGT